MGMSLKEDTDGWITECRESSRKLISPKNREIILSFRKRKFQSEGNQFLSRLTFPWTRSSSTGRIRRPAAGDSSTRGLSSTTAPCTTSDLQSDSLSQHTTSALLPALRDQLRDQKTSFL